MMKETATDVLKRTNTAFANAGSGGDPLTARSVDDVFMSMSLAEQKKLLNENYSLIIFHANPPLELQMYAVSLSLYAINYIRKPDDSARAYHILLWHE